VTSNITEDTPPTSATKFSDSPYDKRAVHFLGAIHLAASVIWLN
jgi:hypothetical protein